MKVALVGATGLVGSKMLEILEERNFPITKLLPVASSHSVGKEILFKGVPTKVVSAEYAVEQRPEIALFSAGGSVSLQLAPLFTAAGCRVIDNSSAWRMHPEIKLIVPEVNAYALEREDLIIANPNCSTIQMVMVLFPLHKKYQIRRVVVSTYQSVSGTGQKAVKELMDERSGQEHTTIYPHKIDLNIIPHIDIFVEAGHTREEIKMMQETCKIMDDNTIKVSATAVRVPVRVGHSESLNITFEKPFELVDVVQLLNESYGVKVIDNTANNEYPMPLDAEGKDDVFVGRIRRDTSAENTLNCWVVADNLRKGAATNAVQIAEYLALQGWIG